MNIVGDWVRDVEVGHVSGGGSRAQNYCCCRGPAARLPRTGRAPVRAGGAAVSPTHILRILLTFLPRPIAITVRLSTADRPSNCAAVLPAAATVPMANPWPLGDPPVPGIVCVSDSFRPQRRRRPALMRANGSGPLAETARSQRARRPHPAAAACSPIRLRPIPRQRPSRFRTGRRPRRSSDGHRRAGPLQSAGRSRDCEGERARLCLRC